MRRISNGPHPCLVLAGSFLLVLFAGVLRIGQAEEYKGSFVSAALMEAETGEFLLESNSRAQHPPASLVKMMVALIVMEKVGQGALHLEEEVTVSRRASQMGGSQVYLKQGEVFTLEQLMKAMMIHSGNDAAVALAEHVAGSAEAFVDLMNLKAGEMGLTDSVFRSVHGLPPGKGQEPDLSSARDLAVIARAVVRLPKLLEWCSTVSEPFRGGAFLLRNTNKLLTSGNGVDGIKTGYTRGSMFSIAATATRDSIRMIAVVLGAPTDRARSIETTRLLTIGFNRFKEVQVARAGQTLAKKLPIRNGKKEEIDLRYAGDLCLKVKAENARDVVLAEDLPQDMKAPVAEGQTVGRASAKLGDRVLGSVDIVAAEPVEEASFMERLFR
jgi:D-alanyl-D-alanine carboxypeptidase (penicillin-binding protein 5/6)